MIGKSITDKEQSEIWLELDDLPIPYMIDLSIKSHIDNPDLIDHIDRVGQIFYERNQNKIIN